jgi:hypothetical protein
MQSSSRLFPALITRTVSVILFNKHNISTVPPAEIVGSNPTGGMDVCLL